ncbi:oxygen-sensing cyclic-di-GMP phosphodiesterase DosP [Escherichia coli]|uniref:oxygen-sensing cyclic-di-GMP phosphodiesterase DosP n=1 Tax=Escherichia coli TaxID=562 RepID=UPI0013C364F7|nr:oxygen-sensing cyclic-di-GMP phosphodiesterase DosP [Escherichia coli]
MKLTDADNAADGIFFPALEQNMMGAVLINENDEVMFFNPAAEKLWGYKREEVIGNNIDMLIPRDLRPAHPEYIRHNREGGKARVEGMSRELQLEKKDGSKIWTRFALSKVSAEGKVYYLALEQEKSRQHIEQLIQFDPMTGLPNRNNLHNYLDDLVDKAVSPVVYLIGVDHIQDVIDSLGYAWADQALLEVVNRFREKLKPDQYLCRIEGTQFVLVSLENDVSNITQIADELRNVVSKPIMIDDKPFPLTLSIGISYDVGKKRDYLLSTAHNAMDYIRKNGGNGWQIFSPAMNEMVKERLVLGAALKEAISNNQLKLVYQPQIFAETGELYGIEALARWHDPQHGHVPPSRFIPLAEEIGEIENIGRWVIAEACRQLAEWRSQNIHIPALSVNLSALHFRSNQLPNQVSDAMHAWGIDGHQLTVEITESMMMEHDTEIFKRIQILRDMGVGLSVDDFGTGFSGLSRLVSLPVTEIKIDKSFVDRCLTEKRILALLEAITSIGQSLNLTVVAEGVETKEQFEMLRKIHCRVIQGYFFSRPLPAEEIPGWMSSVLPLKI